MSVCILDRKACKSIRKIRVSCKKSISFQVLPHKIYIKEQRTIKNNGMQWEFHFILSLGIIIPILIDLV